VHGGSSGGASNDSGAVDGGNFQFLVATSLETLEISPTLLYDDTIHCWPVIECKINYPEWLLNVKIRVWPALHDGESF